MSVARFIADQRTDYRVPHTLVCALLGLSLGWFYKWLGKAQGQVRSAVCTRRLIGVPTPSTGLCG